MRSIFLTALILFTSHAFSQSRTQIGPGAEEYHDLFNGLEKLLINSRYVKKIKMGGKDRNQFVPWIRDHVHVMKAMKYFESDMSSFWEFFMENQTREGLYFDYYFPLSNPVNHRMNLFDKRFWKILNRDTLQMHRLPVEADLEYLMVEGAWYIWQAGEDKKFLDQWLPRLEAGLFYMMNDPLRWSRKHQLVKRGYTLDTWDFMQLPMTRQEYVRQGFDVQEGIFNIDENTPMGIMHGDNSGLYAACRQMSVLYKAAGNNERAVVWEHQAEIIRARTNALCWNGKFYAHFIEDDPVPPYLKMDQQNTLTLSNPYDINRGLPTDEMAASIIKTYRDLQGRNIMNSFSEWFSVYPPVEPHFADYVPGSYMNGGTNTIVGGELAKAAFQNGFEKYGADILLRMNALMKKHKGDLPVSYKPDGTVDEGIPDNWGQAAVMSALVEGLAGVVDKGQGFESVEVSPRWIAAGKNSVEASIAYGHSGKSLNYRFNHNAGNRSIDFNLAGDAKKSSIRILLPEKISRASGTADGKKASTRIEKIGESYYVVYDDLGPGKHHLIVKY